MSEQDLTERDLPTGGAVPRRGSAPVVALVVGVLLLGFVALLATREAGEGARTELIGKAAPAVTGVDIDGRAVDIDRWRGSWVVVNFFATWCTPCRIEHPELVEFAERHADGSAHVVSIGFNDDPAAVRAYFESEGGDWPVLVDDTGPLALDYGVRGVPESYLISPAGQVVALFYGVTADGLDEAIAAASGDTSAAAGGAIPDPPEGAR